MTGVAHWPTTLRWGHLGKLAEVLASNFKPDQLAALWADADGTLRATSAADEWTVLVAAIELARGNEVDRPAVTQAMRRLKPDDEIDW